MSDYTPTTEHVRDGYVEGAEHDCYYEGDVTRTPAGKAAAERFDRWLAGLKREAAAEALDQAASLTESEAPGEPHAGATFKAHAAWLRERAAAYRRNEGENE